MRMARSAGSAHAAPANRLAHGVGGRAAVDRRVAGAGVSSSMRPARSVSRTRETSTSDQAGTVRSVEGRRVGRQREPASAIG
jgi:hypothetical protein